MQQHLISKQMNVTFDHFGGHIEYHAFQNNFTKYCFALQVFKTSNHINNICQVKFLQIKRKLISVTISYLILNLSKCSHGCQLLPLPYITDIVSVSSIWHTQFEKFRKGYLWHEERGDGKSPHLRIIWLQFIALANSKGEQFTALNTTGGGQISGGCI